MPAPKITHQIWLQGWENLPEKFGKNVEALHEMNPEYQHMKWDEKSLRKECMKIGDACVEKFDSFELFISKVDFGRYVVLYNYGGISVDTDMVSLRPLRDTPHLGTSNFLISYHTSPFNLLGITNNAVIICSARHLLLKDALDSIIGDPHRPSDFITKELYVHFTTGPLFFNRFVKKYRDSVVILPYKYFEPCDSNNPYCEIPDDSIMDHQHEMSWMNPIFGILLQSLFFILHYIWYIGAGILCFIYIWHGRSLKGGKQRNKKYMIPF